jgi:hypothetical protein
LHLMQFSVTTNVISLSSSLGAKRGSFTLCHAQIRC